MPSANLRQYIHLFVAASQYGHLSNYAALYCVAPDIVKVAMELAYLCCARQGDILEMKKGQLIDRGILIQQSWIAVSQIKAWTDRLRAAIDLADKLPLSSGMVSIFVLHQQSGSRYTRDSFNAHWMKAKKAAAVKYSELDFNFTFHDLKAKGISDLEGTLSDKQAISDTKMHRRRQDMIGGLR